MFWIGKCESADTGIKLMVQSMRVLFAGGAASLIRICERNKNDVMELIQHGLPGNTSITTTNAGNKFLAT